MQGGSIMFIPKNHESNFTSYLYWAARSLVVFCIGILILFVSSLGLDLLYVADSDVALMLLFLFGFLAGAMLAWMDEPKRGGALAILSVAGFYLTYLSAIGGSIRQLIWIFIFALPGLLFLLYGLISGRNRRRGESQPADP